MARVIAHALPNGAALDSLRAAIVLASALALILAGQPFPAL